MTRRAKIKNFLTINSNWDPSLLFVLGGAVALNLITFYLIMNKLEKPIWGLKLDIPSKT